MLDKSVDKKLAAIQEQQKQVIQALKSDLRASDLEL